MRAKYLAIGIVAGVLLATAALALAGNPAGPGTSPADTYSSTLEDIYKRLADGTEGVPSPWTEPSDGPGQATGYTLSETMALAPKLDDIDGAAPTDVLSGTTYWGLTTGHWGLQTGTATLTTIYEAGLPKTGQTDCWYLLGQSIDCANTGQDGEYQAGVAWPDPRFTVNNDGTVTDNLTGLTWLQNANCTDTVGGIIKASGPLTWTAALTWTNNLKHGDCGLIDGSAAGDWRLPNARELHSLVDYASYEPPLPSGHPFTNVQIARYWSSTTHPNARALAWHVFMQSGGVRPGSKTYIYWVWPVRGGQ